MLTREKVLLHILPALAVFVSLMAITVWSSHAARRSLETEVTATKERYTSDVRQAITERLHTYEVILKGGAGLFAASSNVTRTEWQDYVRTFDIPNRYRGILGIGYSRVIGKDDIPALTRRMRAEGIADFRVYPNDPREFYTAIIYLEPQIPANVRAFGYDMFTNEVRREAMVRARDTGETTLSGRVQLVQASAADEQSGFLMYVPVYTKEPGSSELLPSERTLLGYSYAPFFSNDLFEQLFDIDDKPYGLKIHDISGEDEDVLYESGPYDRLAHRADSMSHTVDLDMYGRMWRVDFRFDPHAITETVRRRPVAILWSGGMFSFLLSALTLTLLTARTRTLAMAEEREVQAAKDELLSLASHQLRTPATGVKQYIGMLREGYAGKLAKQQQELLDKADESNERQLRIINDLLYVAKADAEGIVLAKRKANISTLVRDTVEEQRGEAKRHGHKLDLTLPKRDIFANVDSHCLRMTLENIISNAIKYTPDGGKIAVRLTQRHGNLLIHVKDNGIGISADDHELLFQRFSRLPNELSHQVSGSGIGLYLARHLVRLHGGDIMVESEPGKGSIFTIEIPKR